MKRTWIVLLASWWIGGSDGGAAASDLVQLEGTYIRLTTDIESPSERAELLATFDAAVPQWLEFWNLSQQDVVDWRVHACVMADRDRFENEGLIPADLPNFPFGYALGDRVWLKVQNSEYYTRHLLLHEGAHSLAFHQWQGAGPTWFMEGTAEMLATHRGVGAAVVINQVPADRQSVPYWGRFKRMQASRRENQIPSWQTVLQYQADLQGRVDAYGWSWAATSLLYAYPEYREVFLSAAHHGHDRSPDFNRRLHLNLQRQWPVLQARWRLLCQDFDYGFDWQRERVQLSERDPLWDSKPLELMVAADRGWQSIGVRISPGKPLRISASGNVTLATEPKPWISEPPGITFQFHAGHPLGQLVACVVPNATEESEFLPSLPLQSIGNGATIDVAQYSWVLLCVNDLVGQRADNRGQYQVTIESQ
jgi:hypothetical protein